MMTILSAPQTEVETMMQAVWYDQTGSAKSVLQLGELPVPIPGAGEVRVRIHASGVALTAYQALTEVLQIKAGETILITGGAGGVGSFAVRLADRLPQSRPVGIRVKVEIKMVITLRSMKSYAPLQP